MGVWMMGRLRPRTAGSCRRGACWDQERAAGRACKQLGGVRKVGGRLSVCREVLSMPVTSGGAAAATYASHHIRTDCVTAGVMLLQSVQTTNARGDGRNSVSTRARAEQSWCKPAFASSIGYVPRVEMLAQSPQVLHAALKLLLAGNGTHAGHGSVGMVMLAVNVITAVRAGLRAAQTQMRVPHKYAWRDDSCQRLLKLDWIA
jgi:hypothetical protein